MRRLTGSCTGPATPLPEGASAETPRARATRRSVGQRPAVAPGIGAGHEHAGRGVAANDLHGAGTVQVAELHDGVPATGEVGANLGGEAALEIERIGTVVGPVR